MAGGQVSHQVPLGVCLLVDLEIVLRRVRTQLQTD